MRAAARKLAMPKPALSETSTADTAPSKSDSKAATKNGDKTVETPTATVAKTDDAAKQPLPTDTLRPDGAVKDAVKPDAPAQAATAKTDTAPTPAPVHTPATPTTPAPATATPTTLAAQTTTAPQHPIAADVHVSTAHHGGDTPTAFDKLGLTIAAKSLEGLQAFDIRLDPPDLGRLQIKLTVDDSGQAQAAVMADKPQTLELLQRDAAGLNRALSDAGLNLANNGLSFSLREQQQQQSGFAAPKGRSRSLSATAALSTKPAAASGSYAPNSVRIDIRV